MIIFEKLDLWLYIDDKMNVNGKSCSFYSQYNVIFSLFCCYDDLTGWHSYWRMDTAETETKSGQKDGWLVVGKVEVMGRWQWFALFVSNVSCQQIYPPYVSVSVEVLCREIGGSEDWMATRRC